MPFYKYIKGFGILARYLEKAVVENPKDLKRLVTREELLPTVVVGGGGGGAAAAAAAAAAVNTCRVPHLEMSNPRLSLLLDLVRLYCCVLLLPSAIPPSHLIQFHFPSSPLLK